MDSTKGNEMNHNHSQQVRSNPFGNLCQHGAYADLCSTCHPTDCEIVRQAIVETERLNVAKVDRDARA